MNEWKSNRFGNKRKRALDRRVSEQCVSTSKVASIQMRIAIINNIISMIVSRRFGLSKHPEYKWGESKDAITTFYFLLGVVIVILVELWRIRCGQWSRDCGTVGSDPFAECLSFIFGYKSIESIMISAIVRSKIGIQ